MNASDQFKALADPTRVRIAVLLTAGELCVCDLMAVLKLPQSTISRHMGVLKSAGLVADRRDSRWVHYRLVRTPLTAAVEPYLKEQLSAQAPFAGDLQALAHYRETKACEA